MGIIRSQSERVLNERQEKKIQSPSPEYRSGAEDIYERFPLRASGKLVFIRCHFRVGYGSTAPSLPTFSNMTVSLDSLSGDEWDTLLYTINQRGYGRDVNLILSFEELRDPSPWTFQKDDAIIVSWDNPDLIEWGLEVGLAYL